MQAHISWLIFFNPKSKKDYTKETKLFNLSPNTGVPSSVGIPKSHAYFPFFYSPTNVFFNCFKNRLKNDFEIVLNEKKPPYRVFIGKDGRDEIKINFRIRNYLPDNIIIQINCSSIQIEKISDLIYLQKIQNHKQIHSIAKTIVDIVSSYDYKNYRVNQSFRYKPVIGISQYSNQLNLNDRFNKEIKEVIGALIRNDKHETMNSKIVEGILEKNEPINRKNQTVKTLIDKQGLFYLTSGSRIDSNLDFHVAKTLYEKTIAIQNLLKSKELLSIDKRPLFKFFYFKVSEVIKNQELIFSNSVSNNYIFNVLKSEFKIQSFLEISKNEVQIELNRHSPPLRARLIILGEAWA